MLVNVDEAAARLSELLERAAAGEEIIIGVAGKPVARLVPYEAERRPRRPGVWRGQVRITGDVDHTPDDVIDDFDGR